jgi:hypothetical protein
MSTTYIWGIERLLFKTEENSLQKVIKQVEWYYTANNGVDQVTHKGTEFVFSVDAQNFTEYDSLTEAKVKSWIESKLDHWAIKKGLDADLIRVQNAPDQYASLQENSLPWSNR